LTNDNSKIKIIMFFCYRFKHEGGKIMKQVKYIFVTGGVVSGLGKGITAASLGRLLKERGLKVAAQKLDPYINVDPGTMSPYQHGEVFVTEDGAETDLDLGHYERFIDEDLNRFSNLTSGKVYWNVLNKERRGEYLGETVQVIPHITNEIKSFIYNVGRASGADIVITEVGGTTGDIESQPFLEAIRQVGLEVGEENSLYIHVTLVPYLHGSDEHKSKPTQHSVKNLQGLGIKPDIIVLRADEPIEESIFKKIALFCNVKPDCVIENITIPVLYEAPLMLEAHNFSDIVLRELGLAAPTPDLTDWRKMIDNIHNAEHTVRIGLVGKYVQLHDAYLSVAEALRHAGYAFKTNVEIEWIDSEQINEQTVEEIIGGLDGVVVPGGFGNRGIEGKILTARFCREKDIPYLGICLGMQVAVIDFARHVCGLSDANSGEFDELSRNKVIDFLPDQSHQVDKGGTLRLGAYPCRIAEGTKMAACYGKAEITERHRHRYEFNNDYRQLLADAGLVISGTSPDGSIVETVEVPGNDFFVGVQFHPEFKSRPNKPHPLFLGLIESALKGKI
jgi:CTP synthase